MECLETKFEAREISSEGRLKGYGSVFGGVDRGRDMMMPGAFDNALKAMKNGGSKPKMLWQHNPSLPIGVWDELSADEKGLKVEGHLLTDLAQAKEAHTLLKNDVVDGLSIGYRTKSYKMAEMEDGLIVRQLEEVELWEISVVTFPMDPNATVTDVKQLQSVREVERLLSQSGVPNSFAKLIAVHGFEEAKYRLDGSREADIKAAEQESLRELLNAVKGLQETINA